MRKIYQLFHWFNTISGTERELVFKDTCWNPCWFLKEQYSRLILKLILLNWAWSHLYLENTLWSPAINTVTWELQRAIKKELNTSTKMHSIQEYFCSVSEDSTKGYFLHQQLKKRERIHSKSTIITNLHS